MGSCHIIAMCLKGSLAVELTLMNLLYVIGVTCRALVQSPILEDGERGKQEWCAQRDSNSRPSDS
jgi:hypothetical protein